MMLLKERRLVELDPGRYYRLPLVAGDHSYSFSFGAFVETADCDKHGKYQRRLSASTLERIVAGAKATEPINVWKALDIANGKAGDNEEQYRKQPEMVRIYNPEKLPFAKILISEDKLGHPLAYDDMQCCGMRILVPFYYSAKEKIFEACPKCTSESNRKAKAQSKRTQALS